MNAIQKAAFELQADIARNPGVLDDDGLARLLESVLAESDANMTAAATLLGLDHEALLERAAIIEFDAGRPRATANRLALTGALRDRCDGMPDTLCRWFVQNSAFVMAYCKKQDMDIAAARRTVAGYLRQLHSPSDSQKASVAV